MKEYKSSDIYEILGRGRAYCISNCPVSDIPKIGEEVEIDGITFKVKGVESFWKMLPEVSKNIAILV